MVTDLELQHLYDRVSLVRGKGDRQSGMVCVMTFVALLAGERHSDAPSSASPVVRQFALILNDAMPDAERQLLKPFAPRIVGTADGRDAGRAHILRRSMLSEVFPRVRVDIQEGILPSGPLQGTVGLASARAGDLLISLAAAAAAEDTARNRRRLALLAARLLSACATSAASKEGGAWYWAQAINLLDQLCDVGLPRRARGGLPMPGAAVLPRVAARIGGVVGALRRFRAALVPASHAAIPPTDVITPRAKPLTGPDCGAARLKPVDSTQSRS